MPTRTMRPTRTRVRSALLVAMLTGAALASPAAAQDRPRSVESTRLERWSLAGSISTDLRWFAEDAALPGQLADQQGSIVFAPEWGWRSEDRRHQVKIAPFARWDGEDDERTHFDLREGFYRYAGDRWDLLAGAGRVFWGVAESRHLVDVVNQTDSVEDIDEEDKLGQPMLRLGVTRRWGRLELYSLLGFRERTFPGGDGRLRAPLVVDSDAARYESGAEERHVDWALRWSNAIGDWDLGAHAFYGTGREPRLLLDEASGDVLVPFYDQISQLGADVQYTRGAWLWKLEALVREGQGETFGAAVGGVEYTLYQLVGAADLGLIAELHVDDRDPTAPPTLYDEDTFLGARLALNDIQDTSLLVGGLIDHDDRSTALFVEAERRLTARVSLQVEGRFFTHIDPGGDLAAVERDDVLTLSAAWNL